MPKWVNSDVLDGGLNAIKGATQLLLIRNYTAGDSYATVTGNALASVAMAAADYTPASNGTSRQLTTASKQANATASSIAGDNLHFAFTDGVSKVIWVTDETTDQVVTTGNPVNFPALTYTASQPI